MQFSLMDKGQTLMLVLFGQCKMFTHIRLQMIIIYLQCKIAKSGFKAKDLQDWTVTCYFGLQLIDAACILLSLCMSVCWAYQ